MERKISILLVSLIFAQIQPVSASLVEIDTTAVVYKVIDGDTFDAFPVGRIRLADINTPEHGKPGYSEAKDYLSLMIYRKRVYLDVDDISVMDRYNRTVCLVYVRYNSSHLMNVNLALLIEGFAEISDYYNEFNPSEWTLFVHYPTTALPETYDELLPIYLGLRSEHDSLGLSYIKLQEDYASLQSDYNNLQARYNALKSEHDSLKSDYDKLKIAYDELKNLMYVFIITTIAFIALTAYFARRRPKTYEVSLFGTVRQSSCGTVLQN